jgi:hypothetical protein
MLPVDVVNEPDVNVITPPVTRVSPWYDTAPLIVRLPGSTFDRPPAPLTVPSTTPVTGP